MTRRSHPQVIKDRSPLHPSALRLQDVHPGVEFIQFNRYLGILTRSTFLSTPFVEDEGYGKILKARVLYRCPMFQEFSLRDLGIVPYPYGWNKANFTIRASKEHLLPEPLGDALNPCRIDDPFDDYGYVDDWYDDQYLDLYMTTQS